MSKRFIGLAVALAAFISQPVFAAGEEDSPSVYCAEEARDAGIIDESDIQAYVADCVQQISQELAQEQMIETEEANASEDQQANEGSEVFVNNR